MKELLVATIHFVGLALFSSQVPGEQGLRVVLPSLEQHQTHHAEAAPAPAPTRGLTTTKMLTSDNMTQLETLTIEPHVAAIVYDERAFREQTGWPSEPVPAKMVIPSTAGTTPVYRMVRLNGERVTFDAQGSNPAVAGNADLALPKLACGNDLTFAQKFRYAAMFAIPGGKLSTCVIPNRDRYDTQLTLQNDGALTIRAVTEGPKPVTKTLVLSGNATVYVVNVPLSAMGDQDGTGTTRHYLAYYDLLRKSNPNCPTALKPPPVAVRDCPSSSLQIANGVPQPGALGGVAVSAECSNSTWP